MQALTPPPALAGRASSPDGSCETLAVRRFSWSSRGDWGCTLGAAPSSSAAGSWIAGARGCAVGAGTSDAGKTVHSVAGANGAGCCKAPAKSPDRLVKLVNSGWMSKLTGGAAGGSMPADSWVCTCGEWNFQSGRRHSWIGHENRHSDLQLKQYQ